MTFRRLSEYFAELESTPLRNKMTEILSRLFKEAKENEIGNLCYLLQGRVAPLFTAIEFGLGDKMMVRAVAQVLDTKVSTVEQIFKKEGDLGKTVERIKNPSFAKAASFTEVATKAETAGKQNSKLTINDVYNILYQVATSSGTGSQEIKLKLLGDLLRNVDPLSSRYIVRITLCKLRLGFSDMTMLDSLSWMLKGSKELRPEIERAYNVRPDLGFISETVKKKGIEGLKHVEPKVGTPILMARAERLTTPEEIIEKIGECAIEPKFDGFRCIAGYTPLYVKDKGYISVRDVKVGDYVLTHKGRFRSILAINKRPIDNKEMIFRFESFLGDPIKISEAHPLLVWENGKVRWKSIEQIKTGDYLVFPRPQLVEFSVNGLVNPHLQLIDESGYQKVILAKDEFFRFLGFWIGDGFTNEFHNTERVGLLFNAKTERQLADEYKQIIISTLKIPHISESFHNGSLSVYWRDKPLRTWLSQFFRREWKGKMIPEWFSFIGKEHFLSFLQGWIESDGTERHGGGFKIVTKERDLAAFVQLISLHYGIAMGTHKIRVKIRDYNFIGTYYELIIPGTDRFIKIDNDRIKVKVLKKEQIKRDSRMILYNLQVEEDESYCSGMVSFHNCQIHKSNEEVNIFSRNLENTTKMYPDIVEGVKKEIKAEEAIFEGEAIAYNPKTGQYLPFQETVQRKRKYNIEAMAKKIPLKLIAFDLLCVNGENLINKPYRERRKRLEKILVNP